MRIRKLEPRDVDAVLALQQSCPDAAQWTREDYEHGGLGQWENWVCESGGRIIAFLMARVAADEMEILNLAVAAHWRRRGVATALVARALAEARARGARRAYLEVRESNSAAIAFYHALGFEPAGRRPGYYANPCGDALLLSGAPG